MSTERLLPPEHDSQRRLSHRASNTGSLRSSQLRRSPALPTRLLVIRGIALFLACLLSVGVHYASYVLSPLKSRLSREMGTSNTEFSLLISAFSLNSTWTPLIGGILASRLGTTFTSVLATGVVFLGQAILLLGHIFESLRLMVLGMFIFGLGVSPLAVVQETIIVRFFNKHGLGVSMALGLVAGKFASFVSARTSYPLSQNFGTHAPFYVATVLSGLSFLVNIIYIVLSKWLVTESGTELEAAEIHEEARRLSVRNLSEAEVLDKVAQKRKVNLRDVTKLGDLFWAYIGINVLCGMLWSPFTHLAANIVERRYDLSEGDASSKASFVLAGSVVLYPLCGFIVDRLKSRSRTIILMGVASLFTLACYGWLYLPPSLTGTPIPAITFFAIGVGFSPLLLVVIVPQLVEHKYVSTTLGAHKSLEHVGSASFQTLAGLLLDIKKQPQPGTKNSQSLQRLLRVFFTVNIIHLLAIAGLYTLERRETQREKRVDRPRTRPVSVSMSYTGPEHDETQPLLSPPLEPEFNQRQQEEDHEDEAHLQAAEKPRSTRRGEFFTILSAVSIVATWVLFMVTAYLRLRSKHERQGKQ